MVNYLGISNIFVLPQIGPGKLQLYKILGKMAKKKVHLQKVSD